MPIDASIPLAAQAPQLDLGAIIGNAYQLRQMKQEMTTQNALKAIISEPGAVDDKTGLPTANTLAKITKVAPAEGMKYTSEVGQAQERQAQTEHAQSEAQKDRSQAYRDELSQRLGVYDEDLKSGTIPPDQAERALKEGIHDYLWKDASLNPQQRDAMWGKVEGMKPAQLRALTLTAEQREVAEKGEREQTERERHNRVEEKLGATRAEDNKWQVLSDPTNNTQYRYNPTTGEAKTLDGEPYHPTGAAHIGGGVARSAPALAASRYLQEHPNATAEDLMHFNADLGKTAKAERDFSTGKQGQAINSFNVGIAHLNTLDNLVEALGNTDVKFVNRAKQRFSEEFGATAPTNFDAAKAIVGDEVIKAIVGGGGALADRENAQNQLDRAKTPAQLRGVIKTYKDLMGGQLRGLEKQYENNTGREDFDEKLLPATKRELGMADGAHKGAALPADLPAAAGLPNGAKAKNAKGEVVGVVRDGHWVSP